jgi:hypothetical protein
MASALTLALLTRLGEGLGTAIQQEMARHRLAEALQPTTRTIPAPTAQTGFPGVTLTGVPTQQTVPADLTSPETIIKLAQALQLDPSLSNFVGLMQQGPMQRLQMEREKALTEETTATTGLRKAQERKLLTPKTLSATDILKNDPGLQAGYNVAYDVNATPEARRAALTMLQSDPRLKGVNFPVAAFTQKATPEDRTLARQKQEYLDKLINQKEGLQAEVQSAYPSLNLTGVLQRTEKIPTEGAREVRDAQGNVLASVGGNPSKKVLDWVRSVAAAESEMRRQGIKFKSAFQPGAKQLDEATAAQILKEAGGDENKARQIARQRGFTF